MYLRMTDFSATKFDVMIRLAVEINDEPKYSASVNNPALLQYYSVTSSLVYSPHIFTVLGSLQMTCGPIHGATTTTTTTTTTTEIPTTNQEPDPTLLWFSSNDNDLYPNRPTDSSKLGGYSGKMSDTYNSYSKLLDSRWIPSTHNCKLPRASNSYTFYLISQVQNFCPTFLKYTLV